MANNGNKPPVPCKMSDPINVGMLGGTHEFKVVTLGLQEVVRNGLDAGIGVHRLAREINESVLKHSQIKISGGAIVRWKERFYSDEGSIVQGDNAINVYNEYSLIAKQIREQMTIQQGVIDELSKESAQGIQQTLMCSKALNSAHITYEKLSARLGVLLNTIEGYQMNYYNFEKASRVVKLTLNAVRDKDAMLYADIIKTLQSNPEYVELLRKLQPENKS